MFKRITACVMTCLLLVTFGMSHVALAASKAIGRDFEGYDEVVVEEHEGYRLSIFSKDLPNGDADFLLVENGVVLSDSFLQRGVSVTTTTYSERGAITEVSPVKPSLARDSVYAPAAETYTAAGTIKYRWMVGTTIGNGGAKVSYSTKTNPKATYNVTGRYKNVAKLAALIADGLSLPGAIGSKVALKVLSHLGFSSKLVDFFIPDHVVSAIATTVKWKTVNTANSSHTGSISGTSYLINQPGEATHGKKYTSGHYFPTTSFKNKSQSFAIAVYDTLFPYPDRSVVGWV